MRPNGDGLPGGYRSRQVLAEMKNGKEQAQRLTQAWRAASLGVYLLFSFLFWFGLVYLLDVAFVSGDEGCRGGERHHLAGSPGTGGDIGSCHTLIRVHTV